MKHVSRRACLLSLALVLSGYAWSAPIEGKDGSAPADPEAPVRETFVPRNLGLTEVADLFRDMTGVTDLSTNVAAGTIDIQAPPATVKQLRVLMQVFDSEQPKDEPPLVIRSFRLDRLTGRDAVTLLRQKLQVRQIVMSAQLPRVAVRDSAERLEEAERLLAQAEAEAD